MRPTLGSSAKYLMRVFWHGDKPKSRSSIIVRTMTNYTIRVTRRIMVNVGSISDKLNARTNRTKENDHFIGISDNTVDPREPLPIDSFSLGFWMCMVEMRL